MDAYKVHNKPILRIITKYPQVVDKIVDGLPNAVLLHQAEINSGEWFLWVRCPTEEITTQLGHFLRVVDLDWLLDEEAKTFAKPEQKS